LAFQSKTRRRSNLEALGEAKAIARCSGRTSTKHAGRPADFLDPFESFAAGVRFWRSKAIGLQMLGPQPDGSDRSKYITFCGKHAETVFQCSKIREGGTTMKNNHIKFGRVVAACWEQTFYVPVLQSFGCMPLLQDSTKLHFVNLFDRLHSIVH
jgi:hypothetical protein